MKIVAIVLTHNEERHLARCLTSLHGVVTETLVADCFSTDATLDVARTLGARVVQREWVNYATQFNWALTQLDDDTTWVLRIDADEYLSESLASEMRRRLREAAQDISGFYCGRRMTFQGQLIRHGGVFPIQVLRLFRYGRGRCENRWMDEHVKVTGRTLRISGEIIDDNLNSLTWWTDKHNKYASREAVDLLNLKYAFMSHDTVASLRNGSEASVKRWLKESVYARMPLGLRAIGYFLYRYIVRMGFLDGRPGTAFHFLQACWYRFLVDAKVAEVERHMAARGVGAVEAIRTVLGIELAKPSEADVDGSPGNMSRLARAAHRERQG